MKFVIQRAKDARVAVDGEVIGAIDAGLVVLIGAENDDTEAIADVMIKKLLGLRIFQDAEGKTNLDLAAVGGSLLLISQFTLYADCRKGNRPSFVKAGSPDHARALYDYIVRECRARVPDTQCGSFGAYMQVTLTNDGPFTIVLDSSDLLRKRQG